MSLATREAAAVPWRSRTVQLVLASTLLAPLGVPLVSPALPVVRDAFGLTDAQASLLITSYFLVGIVLSPFIGALADRIGRRRVLVGSLLVFGLAGGIIALAPSYGVVLAIRVVQGTAAAGIFVSTVTIIGDAFEGVQRNAVLGVNNAVLSAGAAAYPLVGGVLAAIAWNAPFLAYLAALPVAVVAAVVLEETPSSRTVRGRAYLRGAVAALAGSRALVYYGAAFLTELLLFGTVFTALPFLLSESFGLTPVGIGLVVTAAELSSVVVSTQNGRLAGFLSNGQLVTAGFACYGVGLLVAWLAETSLVVGAGVVVVGAGLGLSMPTVDAAISDLVTGEYRAGALSLRNSVTFLGRATGPVLFAGLAITTGYGPLLFAAGVVAFGFSAIVSLATGLRER